MSKFTIPYLPVPNIEFTQDNQLAIRPITDHPPILQKTAWGIMATMNMLNPGSPFAPSFQISGVKSLPADGEKQMKAMAEYIYGMFERDVGLLALQEVPPPTCNAFRVLIENLTQLNEESGLIDVAALKSQWSQTGRHAFGTSILYNPHKFTLATKKPTPCLPVKGSNIEVLTRAAVYKLKPISVDILIPIANIHGDYTNQEATKDFVRTFEGICLGDLNIPKERLSDLVTDDNKTALLSIETPTLTIDNSVISMNTADCILDKLSKTIYPDFTP